MPVFSAFSAESYKSAPTFVQFSTQLIPDYHVKKIIAPKEEPEPLNTQVKNKWSSTHKSITQTGNPFRTFNSVSLPKIPAVFKSLINWSTAIELPKKSKSKLKKVIPLVKVKLIKLKETIAIEKGQPKPPLANKKPVQKQNFCAEDLTSEALLKMADEGLAKLD